MLYDLFNRVGRHGYSSGNHYWRSVGLGLCLLFSPLLVHAEFVTFDSDNLYNMYLDAGTFHDSWDDAVFDWDGWGDGSVWAEQVHRLAGISNVLQVLGSDFVAYTNQFGRDNRTQEDLFRSMTNYLSIISTNGRAASFSPEVINIFSNIQNGLFTTTSFANSQEWLYQLEEDFRYYGGSGYNPARLVSYTPAWKINSNSLYRFENTNSNQLERVRSAITNLSFATNQFNLATNESYGEQDTNLVSRYDVDFLPADDSFSNSLFSLAEYSSNSFTSVSNLSLDVYTNLDSVFSSNASQAVSFSSTSTNFSFFTAFVQSFLWSPLIGQSQTYSFRIGGGPSGNYFDIEWDWAEVLPNPALFRLFLLACLWACALVLAGMMIDRLIPS